ncbi:MAG: hypothetical protein ACQEQ4_05300 [Fibrobacterota bacterium]
MANLTEYISGLHYKIIFFSFMFLAFLAASLGDTVSEALLLSVYSADFVSRLFIVNALVLFILSFFALSVIDSYNRAKLYLVFLVLYGISIVVLRSVHFFGDWIYIVLYVLSYTGKIIMFLFVWTLANDMADSRSGARHFPFIAAGGTLGAIAGTFSIPLIIQYLPPLELVWLWGGVLFFSAVLVAYLIRIFGHRFTRRRFNRKIVLRAGDLFSYVSTLMGKPLLRTMAGAYFLIFVIIFCQQYLFYTVVREEFGNAFSISGFLGYFKGIALVATFLIQVTVAGAITRYVGWIRIMRVLPLVFLLSFVLLLVFDLKGMELYVQMVIAGMGLRIAVFDSFFSPNYQNIFSTFPEDVRGKGKLIVDGIVKPLAMITSAVLIAVLHAGLSMTILLIVLSFSALIVILRLQKQYLFTAVQYLNSDTGKFQPSIGRNLSYEAGFQLLDDIISQQPPELKECAVDLLVELDNDRAINRLILWYPMVDDRLKAYIVCAVRKSKNRNIPPFIHYILKHEKNRNIVANALLTAWNMGAEEETLYEPFLSDTHPKTRGNAVYILYYLGFNRKYSLETILHSMLSDGNEDFQKSALWVLGRIPVSDNLSISISRYWYGKTVRILRNTYLWNLFVPAAIRTKKYPLVMELVDMSYALSEVKQKKLLDEVSWLIRRDGESGIINSWGKLYNSHTSGFILKAVAHSGITPSNELLRVLEDFVSREVDRYIYSRSAVRFLKKPECRTSSRLSSFYIDYFIQVVEKEEQLLHFENLIECAAIADKSNAIRNVIDSIHIYSPRIYTRIVDIIDTAPTNKINRLIVLLMEGGGKEKIQITSLKDILDTYFGSGLPVVRESALYLHNKLE